MSEKDQQQYEQEIKQWYINCDIASKNNLPLPSIPTPPSSITINFQPKEPTEKSTKKQKLYPNKLGDLWVNQNGSMYGNIKINGQQVKIRITRNINKHKDDQPDMTIWIRTPTKHE
jgi:hypothetical protein